MSIPYTLPPNLILNKWLVSSAKADDILLFENRITFKKSTAKTDKKNVKKAEVYKISTGQYQSSSGLFGTTTNIQNIYYCKIIKGSYMVWRGKVRLLRKIPACCIRENQHYNFVSTNSQYTVNGQKWKERVWKNTKLSLSGDWHLQATKLCFKDFFSSWAPCSFGSESELTRF